MESHLSTLSIGGLEGRHLECWLSALFAYWGVHEQDRDDLIQETYCRWLARVARRPGRAPVGLTVERTYLSRVARSAMVDQVRARRTAKRGGQFILATSDAGEAAARWLRDPAPSAEDCLLRRERRRALLLTCAAACKRRRRRRDLMVVRLAWVDGFSSREIARLSRGRLRRGSVDSILTRIRGRMRRQGIALPHRREAPARP